MRAFWRNVAKRLGDGIIKRRIHAGNRAVACLDPLLHVLGTSSSSFAGFEVRTLHQRRVSFIMRKSNALWNRVAGMDRFRLHPRLSNCLPRTDFDCAWLPTRGLRQKPAATPVRAGIIRPGRVRNGRGTGPACHFAPKRESGTRVAHAAAA